MEVPSILQDDTTPNGIDKENIVSALPKTRSEPQMAHEDSTETNDVQVYLPLPFFYKQPSSATYHVAHFFIALVTTTKIYLLH